MYPIPKFLQYHDGVYTMNAVCADCNLLAFYFVPGMAMMVAVSS